ncbi:MAG: hypothetical protein AABZ23_02035 [Deltaproteobacteria bacterium]
MLAPVALVAGELAVVGYAAKKAFQTIHDAIAPAYNAVEKYKTTVIELSTIITSLQPQGDLAEKYKNAKEYIEGSLLPMLDEVRRMTAASAEEVMTITREMLKQGITPQEEDVEAYINLINAIKVAASGSQNEQLRMRQEIKGLLDGEVSDNNRIASQIDGMVEGGLKKQLKLWKESGTEIREIGKHLKGYGAGTEDLQDTWAVIGSTMKDIEEQILRRGFASAYKDINGLIKRINEFLTEHGDYLSSVIHKGWLSIKGVIELTWNVLKQLSIPLKLIGWLADVFLEILGRILYVILPPLLNRVGLLGDAFMYALEAASAFFKIIIQGAMLDFEGIEKTLEAASESLENSKKALKEAFKGDLGKEIVERYAEFEKNFSGKPLKKKITFDFGDKEKGDREKGDREKIEKLAKEWQQAAKELDAAMAAGGDEFYKKILDIQLKMDGLREKFKEVPGAEAKIFAAYSSEASKAVEEHYLNLARKERENVIAGLTAEIDQRKRLLDLKKDSGEISEKEAIEEEVSLNNTLIQQKISLLDASLKDYTDEAARLEILKEIAKLKGEIISEDELASKLKPYEGTFSEGWARSSKKWRDSVATDFQAGEKIAEATAQGMHQAFSDLFFDAMTGDIKNLWDYFKSFLESISRAISDILSQKLVNYIIGSSWFSPPAASTPTVMQVHSGGYIMHRGGYVPRFHFGGLSSDEVPAILQKGEYVVSRKGVAALDAINSGRIADGSPSVNVSVSMENKSGYPLAIEKSSAKFDGEKFVVGVVLKDLNGYGPLYRALQGAR